MKHMKKNDGYVMVYVMIVFTILSFVAVSICGMAVKNLQAQKATINRMAARYEAEAYLQEFVAKICDLDITATGIKSGEVSEQTNAKANVVNEFLTQVQNISETFVVEKDDEEIVYLTLSGTPTTDQIKLSVNDIAETVRIDIKFKATLTTEYDDPVTADNGEISCKATLKKVDLEYISYDISYEQKGGAG